MLHLDCCISQIGPDLVFYAPETFLDGLPEVLADVPDKVETSLLEAQALANNAFVIDADTVILDESIRNKHGKTIESHGKTVAYIHFSRHATFGGAMRCKTGVLARYDQA